MSDIGIGIVGSGGMTRRRGRNFAAQAGCAVRSLASRNPETGQALARELGVELAASAPALLERDDVQAVVVATAGLYGAGARPRAPRRPRGSGGRPAPGIEGRRGPPRRGAWRRGRVGRRWPSRQTWNCPRWRRCFWQT